MSVKRRAKVISADTDSRPILAWARGTRGNHTKLESVAYREFQIYGGWVYVEVMHELRAWNPNPK